MGWHGVALEVSASWLGIHAKRTAAFEIPNMVEEWSPGIAELRGRPCLHAGRVSSARCFFLDRSDAGAFGARCNVRQCDNRRNSKRGFHVKRRTHG